MKRILTFRLYALFAFAGLAVGTAAQAQSVCGNVYATGGVGPFDYRDIGNRKMLKTVESFHFQSNREGQLALRGASDLEYSKAKGKSASLRGNLDYTLRAFPNHPHALYAMAMYEMKRGVRKNEKSAECWFERASGFAPDDPAVKHVRGIYYHRLGKYQEAAKLLDEALKISPNNGELAYNAGLSHLELKEYDRALELAHEAIRLGYTLSGLKRRLTAAGAWRDPTPMAMAPKGTEGPQ